MKQQNDQRHKGGENKVWEEPRTYRQAGRHGAGFVREAILMENPMDRGAWQASVHAVTKS